MRRALAALLLLACSDPAADALGPSDRPNGPEHRAGQPCLLCHDFAIAGTVYLHADDGTGLRGATVAMVDAAGHSFDASTNDVGNFYVTVSSSTPAPSQGSNGELRIPWDPVFPVHVKVSFGGQEQTMRTPIGRDGSCAGCHLAQVSATSVGRVWAEP